MNYLTDSTPPLDPRLLRDLTTQLGVSMALSEGKVTQVTGTGRHHDTNITDSALTAQPHSISIGFGSGGARATASSSIPQQAEEKRGSQ